MELHDYWDQRYRTSRSSGRQSHRDWEHSVVGPYINEDTSVLDVGCGDLAFWDGQLPQNYTGVDFSEHIIQQNETRYPSHAFLVVDITQPVDLLEYDVVICLNVLYHLADISQAVKNLWDWTRTHLFISDWLKPPLTYDDRYQFHHGPLSLGHDKTWTYGNFVIYHFAMKENIP